MNSLIQTAFAELIISMIPVIELRGAIPFAIAAGLPFGLAVLIAIVGNLIPIPFIILFIRRIFRWMKKKSSWLRTVVSAMEHRAEKRRNIVSKYAFVGLILLVAIPLPGTGAWTGALVAAMMDIRMRRAIPAITIGVLIAAAIVTSATYGIDMIF